MGAYTYNISMHLEPWSQVPLSSHCNAPAEHVAPPSHMQRHFGVLLDLLQGDSAQTALAGHFLAADWRVGFFAVKTLPLVWEKLRANSWRFVGRAGPCGHVGRLP